MLPQCYSSHCSHPPPSPPQKLQAHDIGLPELHSLTEDHLEGIGVPLGVRVRLLDEVRKLQPIEKGQLKLK